MVVLSWVLLVVLVYVATSRTRHVFDLPPLQFIPPGGILTVREGGADDKRCIERAWAGKADLRGLSAWRCTMKPMKTSAGSTRELARGYRALVVDDEFALAEVVASYLEREQFETRVATNGADAVVIARELDPDVVVLDIGLPGMDGFEVCRQLRTFSDAYVVMLTARDTETDTVVGLTVGADDYVTKPFSPRGLIARIRAMLRRPRAMHAALPMRHNIASPVRRFGPLSIDIAARDVRIADEPILLTRTEFDILEALSARPGVVLSRRQILDIVRDGPWVGNDHLVDVHIGHLRRKLADNATQPRYIATIRGVGYRMEGGQ